MNYLSERKQYVQINTNNSDILITGPQSVSQGSVISGTLYAIYTCDMHYVTHMTKHSSHTEYEKCTKSYINTYVDDAFCIVQTQNEDLWDQISNLIKKMRQYFNNNKLVMNIEKTSITIFSNKNDIKKQKIYIEGNEICHSKTTKVLGTLFNENLDWNDQMKILITKAKVQHDKKHIKIHREKICKDFGQFFPSG